MPSLLRDVRYGARSLRKSPALSSIAILTLALGIGLTTTMFSIVYGAIVRGLPFERAERIMHLERNNPSQNLPSLEVPIHDYRDWRAQQRSFEAIAAFYIGTVNLSGTEKPERFDGAFITANAFPLLRVRPLLGRTFREGEDAPGAAPVILLGYRVWQDRYAGDPGILGRTIRVNGEPAEVVGVMPERFEFPIRQAVWVPLRLDPLKLKRGEGQSLEVFGRLRDGVSREAALAEFTGIAKRLELAYPRTNEGVGAVIKPFTDEYLGEAKQLLYTMLGAVFFVLLIACANVANLLLGRAAQRSKEVGIRTALGASRATVIVQFLAESFLLCASGAAFGIAIAYAGILLFNRAVAGTDKPFWIDIRLDPVALLFVLGVTIVATLASGLLPAVQASRTDVSTVLKDESRGSSSFRLGRLSRALVVFEVALSCGLLVGAGLMIKSVTKLRNFDFGFATRDVFTARVGLFEANYPTDTSKIQFLEQLVARVATLPGVRSAALTTAIPGLGAAEGQFEREGVAYAKAKDRPRARRVVVTPGFFETFDAPAIDGRVLEPQDRAGALPVAVVNRSFARKYFGAESPVGRRIRWGDEEAEEDRPWLTVVGVIPDRLAGEVKNKDPEALYVPLAQRAVRFISVVARASGNPSDLASPVRAAVAAIDPDLPIYFVRTMDEAIATETWFYRVFGSMFMIFGVVALFLAAIGLYAVMAFSVSRRVREMGVRMALGAQGHDVTRLILRQGLLQIAVGMVAGLALAAGVSKLLGLILFEVQPRDPAVFGSVVLLLMLTGAAACALPARRATRVDPMVALRSE